MVRKQWHRHYCWLQAGRGQLHKGWPSPPGRSAWADPLNYIATNGADPSGSGIAAGGGFMGIPAAPWTCSEGCSNDSEIFSFHPDGSNSVLGMGQSSSSSSGLTMAKLSALLSRAGTR